MSQLALQSNAKDMMGSATLSAVRGQGSKGSGAPKRGAGSVGLVADLSNKLARQRKQLDELVAAQAAKKSTWKWYHVLGLILLNNLVVMAIGITAGSAFYGVGPIAEGSFKSGMIKTEGLQVMADEGHQQVVFESTVGTADLTIKAANGFDSTILFAGKDEAARFSMVASGEDYFAIRSSDGRDRISLTQGVTGESELRMDPMGGELVISDDLSFGYDTIRTRNSSMHIMSAGDITLKPGGLGMLKVNAVVDVAETLTVGDSADNPLMVVNPDAQTIRFGTDDRPADVKLYGDITFTDMLTVQHGGIEVLNGDVRFGNADVSTSGNLAISGNVRLGDSSTDVITVRGMLQVLNDDQAQVVSVHPVTGDIELAGALDVEGDTELRGDVILGSKPTDTVTINAYATQMNSLVATGFVQLGDDDDDTITVYGRMRVRNDNNDIVFDIDPYTGNTFTEGGLTVTGETIFAGTVRFGDTPDDLIEILGPTNLHGDTTIRSTLNVLGDTETKDVYAENVTLTGDLRLRDQSEQVVFSVDPLTGNVESDGTLTLEGDALFMQHVTLGDAADDHIRFNGQVLMRQSLTTEMDVLIAGNTVIEGLGTILGNTDIGGDMTIAGDVFLGSGSEDEIVLRGHLLVKNGPRAVFTVDPTSGDVMTEGSLFARGEAYFERSVRVKKELEVVGGTTIRMGLQVDGMATVGGRIDVEGDVKIDGHILAQDDMVVYGSVALGSADSHELTVTGQMIVRNDQGQNKFSVDPLHGDTFVAGSLTIEGASQFANSVELGRSSADNVTVFARSLLHGDVLAKQDVSIVGDLTVDGEAEIRNDLTVHGHVRLGSDATDVINVLGDFRIQDASASPTFTIDSVTGDMFTAGNVSINGNLDVLGFITTPEFIVEHLFVDRINERSTDEGVMIEGVLFRDGGIEWTKAHEIFEFETDAGVTIEDVVMKDGTMTLSHKRAGVSPVGEIDLLTLVNTGHDRDMDGTMSTVKFRQYYDDSTGNHSAADSSSVVVGTENDWSEDPATHNAYMAFYTTHRSLNEERVRITSDGDFMFDTDKVVLRAADGSAELKGDVFIGGDSNSRQLVVTSTDNTATVRAVAGGSADAKVELISPFGDNTSTFVIANDGQGLYNASALLFTDAEANDLMVLTDRGATGDLYIAGNVDVGHVDSNSNHQITVVSGAEAEVVVRAGETSDAAVIITSGVDQQARLLLVDPADDLDGSVFKIFNDGAENAEPTLRFANRDDVNIVSIIDKGTLGDLHVTGDGVFGSATMGGPRTVSVQSNETAVVHVLAGPDSDAFIRIESGMNKEATMIWANPGFVPTATQSTTGSEFKMYNDGAVTDYPTLRISDAEANHLLSITDMGELGNIHVTGNGMFGGPDAVGMRTLTVQSTDQAQMSIVSAGSSEAVLAITAGYDQDSMIIFTDPDPSAGSQFVIWNDGTSSVPTLKITDGTRDAGGNEMLRIEDRGTTGDLKVSGDGYFGGTDAIGPRTLVVQSRDDRADIYAIAGVGYDASITVRSGANQNAKIVLRDPAPGNAGSIFEIVNQGESTAVPTLLITDGLNTMVKIEDTGDFGDMQVTGNANFGTPDTPEARMLSVHSAMKASMEIISGDSYDAAIIITAGADRDARLILSDIPGAGTPGGHFEILNDGSANDFPTLQITNGVSLMAEFIDKGAIGDLHVTGNAIVGGDGAIGQRTLTVQSSEEATIDIISGDTRDAALTVRAGLNRDASVSLVDPASGDDGSTFTLMNSGSASDYPLFKIVDAGDNTMLSVSDMGDTGDLMVSGSALFGGPSAFGRREIAVQTDGEASMKITSGAGYDAILEVVAGANFDAKLILKDPADGMSGSTFEIFNDGGQNVNPTLRITDGDLGGENTLLTLVDMGTTAMLTVTGDAMFGGSSSTGARSLTVATDGVASMSILSGNLADAVLTISAGTDRDSRLVFVDTAGGADGSTFEFANRGASNTLPQFDITDGTNVMLSIIDSGNTGDLTVTGQIQCVNLDASGAVSLGDGLEDEIVINGHLAQQDIVFDANSDGNGLTLHFIEPSSPQIITFPEETGTVLTTTSDESALTVVGELIAGSIVPGFGSIVTTQNIETVGTGTMTAGGTLTAAGNFEASGNVFLGDAADDDIIMLGTVASDIVFDPSFGLKFENSARDKTTRITAAFDPATSHSPAGDRVVTIPDIPSGGTLHVVTKGTGAVSNVGHIVMDTTAGVITSSSTEMIIADGVESIFLTNKLIRTDTVLICTIANPGTGGQLMIRTASVNTVVDRQATIVIMNRGANDMTSTFQVSFSIFN